MQLCKTILYSYTVYTTNLHLHIALYIVHFPCGICLSTHVLPKAAFLI
nr:MAG TPA: cytidine deaminase-like protein [Crassvirales sp.]